MAYPVFAPGDTWWKPNVSGLTRLSITEIEIKDSYTPDASATVVDSWDASAAGDGGITCYVIGTKLIIAGNGSGKLSANVNSSYIFSEPTGNAPFGYATSITGTTLLDFSSAENLEGAFLYLVRVTEIDTTGWDLSKVTTMMLAFAACLSLTNIIDIANWNLSSLQNATGMFLRDVSFKNFDISNWDVSNVVTFEGMFAQCTGLVNLDLSAWKTSRATNLAGMFEQCSGLESANMSDWDVSNLTNASYLFNRCSLLKTVNLSNWNTQKLTNMEAMFQLCSSLESLDISNLNTSNVTSMNWVFSTCEKLKTVDISKWNVSKVSSMKSMFYHCESLGNLDLSKWNTSNVTDMTFTFCGCKKLKITGVSNLNVSKVQTMYSMFESCQSLGNLDLSSWDISNATDLSFMFWGASSSKEVNFTGWNTSKVEKFDHFAAHAGMRRIGIEDWDTSSAINMNAMFHNCAEEELDLSKFDVSNVKYFCQMFENSPNLKRIKGLEKWDTSSGVGFDEMFERCYKLEEVDLSNFDTSKAKNGESASTNGHTTNTFSNMFKDCNNLKKITLGPKFSINGDGTNTSATKKLIFPTPSATYIQEADGNWYDIEGNSYAPDGMLDKTAKTYYAVLSEAFDSDTVPVMVNRGSLTKVAHALRKKTGKTGKMKLNSFSEEIDSFKGEMLVLDDNTTIEAETLIIGGV